MRKKNRPWNRSLKEMKPNKIEISAWKSAVQQINWKNHVFTFRASCHFRNPRDSTLGSLVSQRAFQPRLDQSIFAVNLSMHGLVISFPRRSNRCLTSWETLVNFGQWTRPSRVTRGAFPASAFAPRWSSSARTTRPFSFSSALSFASLYLHLHLHLHLHLNGKVRLAVAVLEVRGDGARGESFCVARIKNIFMPFLFIYFVFFLQKCDRWKRYNDMKYEYYFRINYFFRQQCD